MNPFNFGWYSNNPNNANLVYLDGNPSNQHIPAQANYSMTIPDNGWSKSSLPKSL